ncbi:unnamed protein product [Linum trigynum]|uniref:Uncharacterized protein n=1 Tax=Linum trigynum TaxID=586398 RepID=A0AAV2GSJ7_9ROSI
MPKLGNCLKIAKSGNVFVKPTLELNLKSMDEILVHGPLPRESRYVCLQKKALDEILDIWKASNKRLEVATNVVFSGSFLVIK